MGPRPDAGDAADKAYAERAQSAVGVAVAVLVCNGCVRKRGPGAVFAIADMSMQAVAVTMLAGKCLGCCV